MFVALAIGMGVILNWPGVIATLAMAALCIGLASVYARSPPR
jgi:hypothetical protein